MRFPLPLLTFILILLAGVTNAVPPAGRYVGVLKTTKTIDGLSVTTSVRTEARVSADGRLSIVVAVPEGPSPQTQGAEAQAGETALASSVLQTRIEDNNTCIVPGSRIRPTLPLGTILPGDLPTYWPAMISPPFSGYYTHLGQVRTEGSRFYLSYTDISRERIAVNPLPVPPPSLTEFSYTFRRVSN